MEKVVVIAIVIRLTFYGVFRKKSTSPTSEVNHISEKKWLGYKVDKERLLIGKDSFNMVNPSNDKIGSMVMTGRFENERYVWSDC